VPALSVSRRRSAMRTPLIVNHKTGYGCANRTKPFEMNTELVAATGALASGFGLPRVLAAAGPRAQHRFLEFFAAHIRNPNTREAYLRACLAFFRWCHEVPVDLHHIEPLHVAAYIERHPGSKPTVKQHLAALRMLFDWLVVGQVLPSNPAASVRPSRHVVRQRKTSVLSPGETHRLLESIDTSFVLDLRDRALLGLLFHAFARVSAAVGMAVEDVLPRNARLWVRLEEKGGKILEIPVHPNLEASLNAYLDAAGIRADKRGPLFRTALGKTRKLSEKRMSRSDVYRMVLRRGRAAGIETAVSCHTFRATGITAYLRNGGRLEVAQHGRPRDTATARSLSKRSNASRSDDSSLRERCALCFSVRRKAPTTVVMTKAARVLCRRELAC
jgi:integrase/recombinase XerD